ncbi:UDP-glucose 6-dehydrogenase [Flavipsychrobacter stenotrophus]|uniref:UDP-glucose 6-dehydrogenase n=1 Tax=Flavipsychrobacter stenotrophus TaxID=2077091 RepID=A0A2S7SPB5_9BACT|nr:UDP-glucose/GDP-mannose dehydrogenase family protein [Flavipsychrobacter stenotrophus]PQJ08733.1 UDP-glucose 6-dehydrogenase [Flavipsychrobacter stenotrophus]
MQLAIIGTGYVGLVTGTCFAETGNNVMCIDIDENKVNKLKQGKTPIYEPGLEVLLERNIKENRLQFTTDINTGISGAKVIFLALPTPPGKDGSADLQYVLDVAAALSKIITTYTVIVNKSTVPVGTAEKVHAVLSQHLDPSLFDVVSNPEFLREGVAVEDFLKPDRIVIGTESEKAKKVMDELYQPYIRQGNPIYFMDPRSSEMTKYAANSYLAMRISFMNEMANLCERAGANVDWVRIGMGSDSRIGKRFLFPGIGYGGSCFPKDVKALAFTAQEMDYDYAIINTVMQVNDRQKLILGQKVRNYFGSDLSTFKFALWGLAFKPETDDIRDAPALDLINELLAAGASVTVFDPEAMENVKQIFGNKIQYAESQYAALTDAHALIVVTEWSEFRNPDFDRIATALVHPCIFDGRNVYSLEKMNELGFYYESIGRKTIHKHVHDTLAMPQNEIIRERGTLD